MERTLTIWWKMIDRSNCPCDTFSNQFWESCNLAESGIVFRDMSEADNAEMSKLLADVFSRRDPPAMATQFSPKKLEEIAAIFGTKSAKEGLSSVAVETSSGKIVGAILGHDFGCPPPSEIGNVDLSSEPVIALLDQLEEIFSKTHEVRPGEFLHVFMIAVRDEFSGKGIAQNLLQFCLKQAQKSGYSVAFTEATNQISQSIFRKFGFEEIHLVDYHAFEFNGRKPFQEIIDQRGCALKEIQLST